MCGIAGVLNFKGKRKIDRTVLERMVGSLYHRGPDECGFLFDGNFAMGMSRLSIIDLSSGTQPIHNEDESLWIVFNGEIFNYPELRQELEGRGHRFYTSSDTEVIIHCYEEFGLDFVQHLNGQFAIAIWDVGQKKLVLARDRVGIRPLFYANHNGKLIFGSEIKAIFAEGSLKPKIRPDGLADIFTFWVNIPPASVFENIQELPPGHLMVADDSGVRMRQYWSYSFPQDGEFSSHDENTLKEELQSLLYDAVTIRLRADVPVAAYLSGGIDSSVISSLVKKYHNNDLITFSVTFRDKHYDERSFQQQMAEKIGPRHHSIEVDDHHIAQDFNEVVWFAEKPLMRTAPAPLFALSSLVRNNNIKVVLTGEGADEMFGGYNIFKEDKVRRFWARQPDSVCRPLLFAKLYNYVLKSDYGMNPFWQAFFKKHLTETENPFYSHLLRWENTAHIRMIFSEEVKQAFQWQEQERRLWQYLSPNLTHWHPLNRAQYLEAALFMNGYLLSSQGDRMMMGHSVEGRFPFLDHRVIEFSAQLPPEYKIKVLNEKYLLKQAYRHMLPREIIERPKQPYRAPIARVFLSPETPGLIRDLLSERKIEEYGYFNPRAVHQLKSKLLRSGANAAARDEMAIVACASTQLLHYHFIETFQKKQFKLPQKQKIVDLS